MTTRDAALAGVAYFADIRDIAARVGVEVPSDIDIATRFAATDAIDIAALSADSSMLADVVGHVTGAADTAFDAHGAMPDAWRGRSADAAGTAVAAHVRHAHDAVDQIRVVSSTVSAAVSALARVQAEKHRTLATLRTDRVVGHPISTITVDEVDADAEAIARDIGAAVALFTRTMNTVDAAVTTILSALTESFTLLPAPKQAASEVDSVRPLSRPTLSSRRRGGTVAASPAAALDHGVVGVDSDVLVATISATATIAGAALAAASSVGMAAAGGLGSVITHLIDAVATDGDDVGTDDRNGAGGAQRRVYEVPHPTAPTPPTASGGDEPGTREHERAHPRAPQASTVPTDPGTVTRSESHPFRSAPPIPTPTPSPALPPTAPPVGATSDIEDDPVPRSEGVDARSVPSVGSRSRTEDGPPRGRPDPDDGGGLALAGDR